MGKMEWKPECSLSGRRNGQLYQIQIKWKKDPLNLEKVKSLMYLSNTVLMGWLKQIGRCWEVTEGKNVEAVTGQYYRENLW